MAQHRPTPSAPLAAVAAIAVFVLTPAATQAATVNLSIPDVQITRIASEVTGSFEVGIEVDGEPNPEATAWNVRIDVDDPAEHITLTGAEEADNALFPGSSPNIFASGGTMLRAGDDLDEGAIEVETGQNLLRVLFAVSPDTPLGDYTLSFDADETHMFDGDVTGIPVSASNTGTIAVIPEPATATLLLVGASLALLPRRRSRRSTVLPAS